MTYVPPIRRIQIEVCREYGISLEQMLSPRRLKPLVIARHAAMRRAVHETGAPLSHIGRVFRRDETTVAHALKAAA